MNKNSENFHGNSLVSNDDKTFAVISYISILFLVGLLRKKNSAFVKFHAKQGMALFAASLVVSILAAMLPFIGWTIIFPIGNLVILVCMIIGMINASKGLYWKIPYGIGDWIEKIKI